MDRRTFLHTSVVVGATLGVSRMGHAHSQAQGATGTQPSPAAPPLKGRLKQSVCRWCYGGMQLDALCAAAKGMGLQSVELLSENEWPVVAAHGLKCAVANGPGGITRGWNDPAMHDELVRNSERLLPLVAAAGIPNMIVFSGNRNGMSEADGLRNCATGLARIMPLAEKHGVTVIMELLNSRVDHKDYMCDHTPWGVALCKAVKSDRFRLLYDIYHMQIMEGDLIRTIRDNAPYLAHFHTAGNPGRSNLDNTQELDYRGICAAIVDTGYKGYLGQEFLPRGDAMTALRSAVQLCDV